jgi:hypothetical protein
MATTENTNNTVTTETPKAAAGMSNGRRILTLAIGDTIAFLVFSALGRGSHGEATGLAAIPQVVLTALPFIIGWFIVAPFLGPFRRDLADNPRKMAVRTSLAWILAWPIGLVLHWVFQWRVPTPDTVLSFGIVSFTFNLLVLLAWRWSFAFASSLKKS